VSTAASTVIVSLLAAAVLRSLVLATAMEGVLRLVQKHAPRTALGLCKLTLLACLAMPALPYGLPSIQMPLDMPAVLQQLAADRGAPGPPGSSAEAQGNAAQWFARSSSPAPAGSTGSRNTHWLRGLIALYLGGVLVLGMRLATGLLLSHRLRRRAQTLDAPRGRATLFVQSQHLGLRHPPPLLTSRALITPVTVGLWRPAILLPENSKHWDQSVWTAVLLHELGHAARRDPLALLMAELYRVFFWFHPVAWWLRRRLAELAEAASDDLVLSAGIERHHYAAVLLTTVAAVQAAGGRIRWPVPAMARQTHCSQRLERILTWQPGGGFFGRRAGRMLAVLALLATVGTVASLRLRTAANRSSVERARLISMAALSREARLERSIPHGLSALQRLRNPGRPLDSRTTRSRTARTEQPRTRATSCPSCSHTTSKADPHRGPNFLTQPAKPKPAPGASEEADRGLDRLLDPPRRPLVSSSIEIWVRLLAIRQQIWQAEQEAIELEQIQSRFRQQMLQLENQLHHVPGLPFDSAPRRPATGAPVPLERISRPSLTPPGPRPVRRPAPVLRATI
jgi:beta-lactamase regulating signal transducer with metallopeptidase domain